MSKFFPPQSFQWLEFQEVNNKIEDGTYFIGWNKEWIHPDFNNQGLRLCLKLMGRVESYYWSGCFDIHVKDEAPDVIEPDQTVMPTYIFQVNTQHLKELF